MKTLTDALPESVYPERFAVSRNPKLVARWQYGVDTMSGHEQWKLHLTPRALAVIRPRDG